MIWRWNTYNNRFSSFPNHEKLVEAIFGECLNYKGGLRGSWTRWLSTREYSLPLFAPRASAPWVRGRELGFETWERTNTDIYKNGICPKIYTAGFFRLKKCTRSIPPNLNSFSGKNTKNAWKWRNLHCWQKFYTWQNGYFCQQICSKFIFFWETTFSC